MSSSAKSEADLQQAALAMMMMAGGEGASTSSAAAATTTTEEVVGVKTRSSSSRSSSLQQNRRPNQQQRIEPVSRNCLNRNKNRNNYVSPGRVNKAEVKTEVDDDYDDDSLSLQPAPLADESDGEDEATDLVLPKNDGPEDEAIICAINPMAIQSPGPESPTDSQRSTNSGSGNGNIAQRVSQDGVFTSTSRRMFRPEFKQRVLNAFNNDPECVGNQRATARKFGIHRRQVQKWLQQLSTGELSFTDLQQPSGQESDNTNSLRRTSDVNLPSTRQPASTSNTSKGKRRIGNGTQSVVANQQQITRNLRTNVRPSDVPARPTTRQTGRNRGKSMPVKGDGKQTYIEPTNLILPTMPFKLTKGAAKQSGSGSSGNSSSSYVYHNDTNGNGTNGGSNLFMNMSTLLASAAAAASSAAGIPLEHPHNFSPRDHSPLNNSSGSPGNSSVSNGGGSPDVNVENALRLVEELRDIYPFEDYRLLRRALLTQEITLEKLARPVIRNDFFQFLTNGNGNSVNEPNRRTVLYSPSPRAGSSQQTYPMQQALDIIRNHPEYWNLMTLAPQYRIANPTENPGGLHLSELPQNGPLWFNPSAAAVTAGLPISSCSTRTNGGKFTVNGYDNSKRKETNPDNHRFASPRVPPPNNSGKTKTVAAALAATRVQSTQLQSQQMANRPRNQNGRQNLRANQRQRQNVRHVSRNQPVDDDIDPTSMLEVVTSIPSPSESPRSNQFGFNDSSHHRGQRNKKNQDYSQGMDLSTTAPSTSQSTNATPTTTKFVKNKAMNKEYSILNVLGLTRKAPETEMETPKVSNGYGITHTASLENFVHNILPPRTKSPPAASSSASSSSPPATELNDVERKTNAIQAYLHDPDIAGNARAVARKYGFSSRAVQKWLKENNAKGVQQFHEEYHENGLGNGLPITYNHNNFAGFNGDDDEDDSSAYLQTQHLHKSMQNESNNNAAGSSVNKRKNSKPNQICDFPMENEMNGALDMVIVPIKKRRVSSPNPDSEDK